MNAPLALLFLAVFWIAGCGTPETYDQKKTRLEAEAARRSQQMLAEREKRERERKADVIGVVRRYHQWPAGVSNAAFTVFFRDGTFDGSPQERYFAHHLCALLAERGWHYTNSSLNVRFVFAMDYGLVDRQEHVTTRNIPQFGQTGGGTHYYSGFRSSTLGPRWFYGHVHESPRFGLTGYRTKIDTKTSLTWRLDLTVYELARSTTTNKPTVIFEGSVAAVSLTAPEWNDLVPGLINALMKDFPGESGRTDELNIYPTNARKFP